MPGRMVEVRAFAKDASDERSIPDAERSRPATSRRPRPD
jgi:hypothetical protein